MTFRMLDLFCGMGGFSVGFHRQGFECYGLDIVDVGYPYYLALHDILELRPTDPQGYFDVVLAGPPCTEYSPLTNLSWKKGQRGPPEPHGPKGTQLVEQAKRVIDHYEPKIWVLENVKGSRQYIERILGAPKKVVGPYCLWGNFPEFKVDGNPTKNGGAIGLPEDSYRDPLRSWKRARIPIEISLPLARACKASLSVRTATK